MVRLVESDFSVTWQWQEPQDGDERAIPFSRSSRVTSHLNWHRHPLCQKKKKKKDSPLKSIRSSHFTDDRLPQAFCIVETTMPFYRNGLSYALPTLVRYQFLKELKLGTRNLCISKTITVCITLVLNISTSFYDIFRNKIIARKNITPSFDIS